MYYFKEMSQQISARWVRSWLIPKWTLCERGVYVLWYSAVYSTCAIGKVSSKVCGGFNLAYKSTNDKNDRLGSALLSAHLHTASFLSSALLSSLHTIDYWLCAFRPTRPAAHLIRDRSDGRESGLTCAPEEHPEQQQEEERRTHCAHHTTHVHCTLYERRGWRGAMRCDAMWERFKRASATCCSSKTEHCTYSEMHYKYDNWGTRKHSWHRQCHISCLIQK